MVDTWLEIHNLGGLLGALHGRYPGYWSLDLVVWMVIWCCACDCLFLCWSVRVALLDLMLTSLEKTIDNSRKHANSSPCFLVMSCVASGLSRPDLKRTILSVISLAPRVSPEFRCEYPNCLVRQHTHPTPYYIYTDFESCKSQRMLWMYKKRKVFWMRWNKTKCARLLPPHTIEEAWRLEVYGGSVWGWRINLR